MLNVLLPYLPVRDASRGEESPYLAQDMLRGGGSHLERLSDGRIQREDDRVVPVYAVDTLSKFNITI